MKKCKRCNGKGYTFEKSNAIFTGKVKSILGFEIPELTSGYEKGSCPSCFGKGMK